jgi:DNA polymerase-3 subunit delta'
VDFPYSSQVQEKLEKIKDSPGQAYLFYGSRGLGKLRSATYIACELLGLAYIDVSELAHPNLIYTHPKEGKKLISISQVRDISERIWKTSVSDKMQKIVIVDGIDKISLDGANALLKNLEDCPPQTSFFLIADSASAVLPTIRSRSQLVYFSLPKKESVTQFLQSNHGLDTEAASDLVDSAHGLPELATSFLDSEKHGRAISLQKSAQDFLFGTITQGYLVAKEINEQKQGSEFLTELLYATKQQSTILVLEENINKLEVIMKAQSQIAANVSTRTVIESLALQMAVN